MQLIYRGATYTYSPDPTTARRPFQLTRSPLSTLELIYRGSTYQLDPSTATKPALQPCQYQLIYRGTTYQLNRNEQGKLTAMAPSANLPMHRPWSAHPVI